MNLDERIQSLRKRSGLSQEQLAEAIGVSRQAVSRWETGAALLDAMNVLALSRLSGVTADYLLGGGSAPSPPPHAGEGPPARRGRRRPSCCSPASAGTSGFLSRAAS